MLSLCCGQQEMKAAVLEARLTVCFHSFYFHSLLSLQGQIKLPLPVYPSLSTPPCPPRNTCRCLLVEKVKTS